MYNNTELKIYPKWFKTEEEKNGLDEIRSYIREGNYPVSVLVIEEDAYFIQAIVPKVTDELLKAAYDFNDGSHSLLFDFIDEDRIILGEKYHV